MYWRRGGHAGSMNKVCKGEVIPMELSIVVARILALTYLAAGIAAFGGAVTFGKMIDDFERSPALTFVTGFLTLVLGTLLVTYHNVWVKNWTVLITIIGWMSVLKGVLLIAFPRYLGFCKGWYRHSRAWGCLMLAMGVLFGYFGFLR